MAKKTTKAAAVTELRRAIAQAERNGLSRYRLAKAAGIDQSQLSKIARGLRVPTLHTAGMIVAALGKRLAIVDNKTASR